MSFDEKYGRLPYDDEDYDEKFEVRLILMEDKINRYAQLVTGRIRQGMARRFKQFFERIKKDLRGFHETEITYMTRDVISYSLEELFGLDESEEQEKLKILRMLKIKLSILLSTGKVNPEILYDRTSIVQQIAFEDTEEQFLALYEARILPAIKQTVNVYKNFLLMTTKKRRDSTGRQTLRDRDYEDIFNHIITPFLLGRDENQQYVPLQRREDDDDEPVMMEFRKRSSGGRKRSSSRKRSSGRRKRSSSRKRSSGRRRQIRKSR